MTISGAPSTHVPRSPKSAALHFRADEKATCRRTSHSGGAGKRRATAASVSFASGPCAMAPSASATGASGFHGTIRSKVSVPSVRVPVLSKQTTSTRARPSTAGSCCTSTRCRARPTAATAKARLVRRTSPCGHHSDQCRHGAAERSVDRVVGVELAHRRDDRHRDDRPRHVAQDLIDPVHQLRSHQRESPRLDGEAMRIRVGPHRRGPVAPRARYHEAA